MRAPAGFNAWQAPASCTDGGALEVQVLGAHGGRFIAQAEAFMVQLRAYVGG
jgi:hypothetical protein